MKELDAFQEVDEELFKIGKKLRPLFYSNPINEDIQKDLFLSGDVDNPAFEYLPIDPDEDPVKIKEELKKLSVPWGLMRSYYRQKIKRTELTNKLTLHRGNYKKRLEISKALYGKPSTDLIKKAKKILSEVVNIEEDAGVSVEEFVKKIRSALIRNNLNDWSVEIINKRSMMVQQELKKIFVGKDVPRSNEEIERLLVHEIGWHVTRAANGYKQRLKLFVTGFPNYYISEEGGALFLEKKLGILDPGTLRKYAARVLAVDALYKGKSFREVFNIVKAHGFSKDNSWGITLRVFRGGALGKDYIYLKGLYELEKNIKKKEDLELMYIGKVSYEDLRFVRKLIDKKLIGRPNTIPDFIKDIKI